jgi:protein gp37
MSDHSHIEWTEATWNFITGCTKVSDGCVNCYIERTPPFRINGRRFDKAGIGGTTGVKLHSDRLGLPMKWRKPRRIFVNSLADLFHEDVPDRFIVDAFAVMALAPQHTFQVLTKRHARMRSLLSAPDFRTEVQRACLVRVGDTAPWLVGPWWPLRHVWLGVSVEDQKWADIRIPALLDTPATVRWLSCEPLIGPVDLTRIPAGKAQQPDMVYDALGQRYGVPGAWQARSSARVDWVVAGGESGPTARPMHPAWARSLRDQCVDAGVPYFFKQWGEWAPNGWRGIGNLHPERERLVGDVLDDMGHREVIERLGKKKAGRALDGRTWDEYPASISRAAVAA